MQIRTAQVAAALLDPLFSGREREFVATLHLDQEQRLLALTVERVGEREAAELPAAEILAKALRIGASAVVVAHNHPSGRTEPSEQDLAATRHFAETAARVGIRVHDHLIVAGGAWQSFRALGLL